MFYAMIWYTGRVMSLNSIRPIVFKTSYGPTVMTELLQLHTVEPVNQDT